MNAFIPSRRTLLGTRVDLSIYNILSESTLDYSTDVLIHKGFMNSLRLEFSGIDGAEVKDLNYCFLLFFILCYSRFIRSALRKNWVGWQHGDAPAGRLYQEEEIRPIFPQDMKENQASPKGRDNAHFS